MTEMIVNIDFIEIVRLFIQKYNNGRKRMHITYVHTNERANERTANNYEKQYSLKYCFV